jgi:hypothetical protein
MRTTLNKVLMIFVSSGLGVYFFPKAPDLRFSESRRLVGVRQDGGCMQCCAARIVSKEGQSNAGLYPLADILAAAGR